MAEPKLCNMRNASNTIVLHNAFKIRVPPISVLLQSTKRIVPTGVRLHASLQRLSSI